VHEGVYRERVNPPRGGESDAKRIVYQAAPGEKVVITGSEIVKNWTKVEGDVWKVTIPNTFFGTFNPYSDLIRGDWFDAKKREHHTGAVYLNGEWLTEAATLADVMKPSGVNALWFGKVEGAATTIWAQFPATNPNEQLVEINVRQTVFYPDKPGRNFITVRGFTMRHAATPWAPPTAEQIGLIGTHWSKGWIIEGNTISHSICSGITLGKYGDQFDNTSANTAGGYTKTIERAHAHAIPWTKEHIGHHIVRNNCISHCEQAGIVGSLGCAFSTVTGNIIHDIHVRRSYSGCEMAGLKFHAAIDMEISRNHVYRCSRGLWLDWMAQGTRVSGNLFHDNASVMDWAKNWEAGEPGGEQDMFVEVNHGPFLVDNNLFLSPYSVNLRSRGCMSIICLQGPCALFRQMRALPRISRRTPPMWPALPIMCAATVAFTTMCLCDGVIYVVSTTPNCPWRWTGMYISTARCHPGARPTLWCWRSAIPQFGLAAKPKTGSWKWIPAHGARSGSENRSRRNGWGRL
jgi:alpha-N-arabinofuranosidase